MKNIIFFLMLISISKYSWSEDIRIKCSAFPIEITTFPNSFKNTIFINGRNIERQEDGWTWRLEGFKLTDSMIEFTESMNPPIIHKNDWVNPKTHYKINRLTGSLEIYRQELDGQGRVLRESVYPTDQCTSIQRKF